jgi:fatty-acid desaturase
MITQFYTTQNDGIRYQRAIIFITILTFGQLALAIAHVIPYWIMALTMPILIPRWMLYVHEMFHVLKPEQIYFITRQLPMAFTPFVLSYTEHQDIHTRHHKFMCTEDDPEYFQLKGGYLTGLFNAMTMPEQTTFRWLRQNRINKQLALTMTISAIVFFGLVYLAGWNFLWYWIPVRISYGISGFAFFYMLHRRGEEFGVYPVKLPVFIAKLYALLFGNEALQVTCNHDLHHDNPRIAGYCLDEAREQLLASLHP